MIEMNICFASDNNYAPYMGTAIASVLKNSLEDEKITFHLIDGGITKENKDKILSLKSIKDCEIKFYTPDIERYNDWFEKTKYKMYYSPATFYRISIPSLIKNVDKILYLDCDIIVTKSLRELFLMDLENYYAFVVLHKAIMEDEVEFYGDLFCAGFLMINNKLWKENNIEQKCIEYYENNYENCFNDQDVLNEILKNKVKYLPEKWLFFADKRYHYEDPKLEDVIIIHHLGLVKPWEENCHGSLLIDEYWKYYQYTPWFRDEPITAFQTILKQKFYDYDDVRLKGNWIKLFGIYSSNKVLQIVIFGIQINIKVDYVKRRDIGRLLPFKKWRDRFREKFK
ncbi:lipopolysaccharide 1,2-glucosyltransferase [Brachyspira suanatina]|uniref:Lipopolysaccharide 1,2-glucosyltransferase n=1 Tax=Brachyspira suanatina TaxID=381802 RepID=A0A0G4K7E3_9SPIR|nr:glycosyltransferase family 8 protein [Brachyspira suanatina]CRF33641.1 lipopolysaccharide 1,2-glucosyltransferase [Brachyspira suanatina]